MKLRNHGFRRFFYDAEKLVFDHCFENAGSTQKPSAEFSQLCDLFLRCTILFNWNQSRIILKENVLWACLHGVSWMCVGSGTTSGPLHVYHDRAQFSATAESRESVGLTFDRNRRGIMCIWPDFECICWNHGTEHRTNLYSWLIHFAKSRNRKIKRGKSLWRCCPSTHARWFEYCHR